jgi:hypothetical protein
VTSTESASAPSRANLRLNGDPTAFAALMSTAEFALLPGLRAALGRNGLEPGRYPAAQALHELGDHAQRFLATPKGQALRRARPPCDIEPCAEGQIWDPGLCQCREPGGGGGGGGGGGDPICGPGKGDLRGDPCGSNCLGMCGPGCTCWDWVCGDCEFHDGCYTHDLACRACDDNPLDPIECGICYTPIAVIIARTGC